MPVTFIGPSAAVSSSIEFSGLRTVGVSVSRNQGGEILLSSTNGESVSVSPPDSEGVMNLSMRGQAPIRVRPESQSDLGVLLSPLLDKIEPNRGVMETFSRLASVTNQIRFPKGDAGVSLDISRLYGNEAASEAIIFRSREGQEIFNSGGKMYLSGETLRFCRGEGVINFSIDGKPNSGISISTKPGDDPYDRLEPFRVRLGAYLDRHIGTVESGARISIRRQAQEIYGALTQLRTRI